MCGQENGLCFLKLMPEVAKVMIRRITDFWESYLRKVLECGKGTIDIIENCNDFGTQRSMFISAEDFREFFKSPLKRLYGTAKEYGVLYMQHSCGSIDPIIDDFIEMGADILNPIQWRCRGMERDKLELEFGEKVVFHGGVDNQKTLAFDTVEAVEGEVRYNLDVLGRGGGYILAPCHNIQAVSPPENIVAMYETGYELGRSRA